MRQFLECTWAILPTVFTSSLPHIGGTTVTSIQQTQGCAGACCKARSGHYLDREACDQIASLQEANAQHGYLLSKSVQAEVTQGGRDSVSTIDQVRAVCHLAGIRAPGAKQPSAAAIKAAANALRSGEAFRESVYGDDVSACLQ